LTNKKQNSETHPHQLIQNIDMLLIICILTECLQQMFRLHFYRMKRSREDLVLGTKCFHAGTTFKLVNTVT